ncbi:MAG TPA: tetratricopeptide repeat protein, partial [Kofleriaceae bacterium]|nr:tetratricopeptide repeat protein [Kofleriaceae bacterium]
GGAGAGDGPVSAAPDRAPIPMIRLASMQAPASSEPGDGAAPAGRPPKPMQTSGSFPVAAPAPWAPAPFEGEFDDELDDPNDRAPATLPPPQMLVALPTTPAARRRSPLIPIIVGVAAVAVVAVVLLTRHHGSAESATPPAGHGSRPTTSHVAAGSGSAPAVVDHGSGTGSVAVVAPGSGSGSVAAVEPGSGSGSVAVAEPGSGSGSVASGSGSGSGSDATVHKPAGPSAATLYKEGQASFMIGNNMTALQLFESAVHRDPHYAVAHRAMGLVYDRLGDRAKAAKEYKAYLKLSPHAKDAALIKSRLEKLP